MKPFITKNMGTIIGHLAQQGAPVNAANHFTGTRILQGLSFLQPQRNMSQMTPRFKPQGQRSIVTLAAMESLKKTPVTKAIAPHVSFQDPQQSSVVNIKALQRKTLPALSSQPSVQPKITAKIDPTAQDIENLVRDHGPACLSLFGLLPKEEGGGNVPTKHTVLVTGTFRDAHGTLYAAVVDGNHLAKNPIKSFAENYATQHGKALHELNHTDHKNITHQLAHAGHEATFDQVMYRSINLDRALEAHDATITRHQNFLNNSEKEAIFEPDFTINHAKLSTDGGGEIDYDNHATLAIAFDADKPSQEAEFLLNQYSEITDNEHAKIDKTMPDGEFDYDNHVTYATVVDGLPQESELSMERYSEIVYDEHAKIDGKMPDDVVKELLAQIKSDPRTVEPFIPLHGPAANADLFIQVPATAKVFEANSVAGKWKALESVEELKNIFKQEPVFTAAVDNPENQPWFNQLFNKINAIKMPAGHRGIELALLFPVTYGSISHIAPMSLWRDDKANLKMALLHQEAIPIKGAVWEGQIYPTFDTAKDYPTGHAPVLESIKFTGMPDVTRVLPVKYPDKLVPLAAAMAGSENAYPYGATREWHGDKGRFPESRPFNSCTNTSFEAHKVMMGEYPLYESAIELSQKGTPKTYNKSTIPHFQEGTAELYNFDLKRIQEVEVGGTKYNIKDVPNLPFKIAGSMWPEIALGAGRLPPNEVPATYITQQHKKPLPVAEGQPLPSDFFPADYRGAKFINSKGLATADGKPVKRDVFYTPDQVAGMTFTNDNPKKKLDFWIALDNPINRAE